MPAIRWANQVTAVFCPLPVGEADPRRRPRTGPRGDATRISAAVSSPVGGLALTQLGDFVPRRWRRRRRGVQALAVFQPGGHQCSRTPGRAVPGGRQMQACYPAVPLAADQTVCIGLLSYNGDGARTVWGRGSGAGPAGAGGGASDSAHGTGGLRLQ